MSTAERKARNEAKRAVWESLTVRYTANYKRGVTYAVNAWGDFPLPALLAALGELRCKTPGTMDVAGRAWHDAECDTIIAMIDRIETLTDVTEEDS